MMHTTAKPTPPSETALNFADCHFSAEGSRHFTTMSDSQTGRSSKSTGSKTLMELDGDDEVSPQLSHRLKNASDEKKSKAIKRRKSILDVFKGSKSSKPKDKDDKKDHKKNKSDEKNEQQSTEKHKSGFLGLFGKSNKPKKQLKKELSTEWQTCEIPSRTSKLSVEKGDKYKLFASTSALDRATTETSPKRSYSTDQILEPPKTAWRQTDAYSPVLQHRTIQELTQQGIHASASASDLLNPTNNSQIEPKMTAEHQVSTLTTSQSQPDVTFMLSPTEDQNTEVFSSGDEIAQPVQTQSSVQSSVPSSAYEETQIVFTIGNSVDCVTHESWAIAYDSQHSQERKSSISRGLKIRSPNLFRKRRTMSDVSPEVKDTQQEKLTSATLKPGLGPLSPKKFGKLTHSKSESGTDPMNRIECPSIYAPPVIPIKRHKGLGKFLRKQFLYDKKTIAETTEKDPQDFVEDQELSSCGSSEEIDYAKRIFFKKKESFNVSSTAQKGSSYVKNPETNVTHTSVFEERFFRQGSIRSRSNQGDSSHVQQDHLPEEAIEYYEKEILQIVACDSLAPLDDFTIQRTTKSNHSAPREDSKSKAGLKYKHSLNEQSLAMFGRKSHGDVKKSAVKVLDAKKDTVTRLKHLKVVLDNYETVDARNFFEQNYSHIYYVFYDVFIQVESDLKQRVTKAHKEELDTVLHIFEKILVLLPELIHKRWQYHSIGRLMKKMLHSGNTLKLRKEGIKLFLLWYKILMDNATEECHRMFANLVPRLGSEEGIDLDTFTVTSHPDGGKVMAVEVTPMLVPQSIEKSSENVSKELLDTLLRLMVTEVNKVEWSNQEMHEFSFKFLFNKFKHFYLHNIFPEFKKDLDIYQPCLDLPDKRILDPSYSLIRYQNHAACQEVVIKWICRFTQVDTLQSRPNNSNQSGASNHSKENGTDVGSPGNSDGDKEELSASEKSNTLTLGNVSERESLTNASLSSEDHVHKYHNEYAVVRKILYSSKENINIIHEIFRQALLMPFNHSKPMKYVVSIYRTWLEQDSRPVFMQEPEETGINQSLQSDGNSPQLNDTIDAPVVAEFSPPVSSSPNVAKPHPVLQRQDSFTDSFVQGNSGDSSSLFSESKNSESQVKVGMQKILQVFITNSANVFLLEPAERDDLIDEQIEMCKRVLNIYRYMVVNVYLDQRTWEQMLQVLLKVTAGVLTDSSPKPKEKTLGSQLAQPLIQTLIVTWIKANLNVFVSAELWDRFLQVLSSLTQWVELIKEWSKTMETLTRLLARHVYDLDLKDLPLDRLSEQKEKRRRGGVKPPPSNSPARGRTFSRGWTKEEPVANLRKAVIEGKQGSVQENGASSETLTHNNGGSTSHPDLNIWSSQPTHFGLAGMGLESEPRTLTRSSSDTDLLEEKKVGLDPGSEAAGCAGDRSSLTEEVLGMYFSASEDVDEENSFSQSHQGSLNRSTASYFMHVTGPEDHDRRSTTASIASTVTDSTSVASVDSSQLHYPYQNLDHSGSSNAVVHSSDQTSLSNKSDTEGLLYIAANASPGADDSDLEDSQLDCSLAEGGEDNLAVEGDTLEDVVDTGVARRPPRHKDSPTPDRESIHIDDMEPAIHHQSRTMAKEDKSKDKEMEETKGILAGGHMIGWTADAAVVLWRRMLGALGDINAISDPEIHAQVFEYFCDLTSTLFRMRDNMGVTKDNQFSPAAPELLPPVDVILPWLFESLNLPDEFKQGKLLAYRLLCMLAVRHHDIEIDMDKLTCFYCILHHGLVHGDQDAKNVLIKFCGPKFFSLPLPGSSMLILDFIHAANTIASTTDLKEAPRTEAISTLGALLCYPNQFGETLMLEPEAEDMELKPCSEIKDQVINILLKSGKKEPAGLARCVTISSLGIFLYEELSHQTLHPKLKDAVSVLLVVLRLQNKLVAQVAADMLRLLTDHVQTLLEKMPDIPCRIIEVITNVISTLLPSTENSNSDDDKRLMVSAMFCLLEWCMRVPLSMLLDTSGGHKSLIYKVFRVLNMAVNGTRGTLTPRGSMAFDFMSPDDDLEGLKENRSVASTPRTPSMDAIADISSRSRRSPTKSAAPSSQDLLKLSAKTVMSHLIHHVGHFPMNEGAACLNTLVKEYDDVTSVALDELSPDIFFAPNVQFCVVNNSSLVSLVEIPAPNVPGGGVTAGLTTGKTVTRVIIRDASGKFCWDSAILYGPPRCRAGSYPKAPQPVLKIVEDIDLIGCTTQLHVGNTHGESLNVGSSSPASSRSHSPHLRKPFDLPTWDSAHDGQDNLDDLLAYIGHTSPECLLHPGEPLNIPEAGPAELVQSTECVTCDAVQQQEVEEFDHFQTHKSAASMLAQALDPMGDRDPSSPFQLCRLFLNQLGFFQWSKRPHVDLLKKSDKLLREIKHLDSQRWRDKHKIAVIYIGKGQEDKKSILNNKGGSKDYEDFVAGLGWEVDLETHQGFLGGLQTNKSTGTSTPYYATSTLEVIFHVSTRMPSNDDEDLHRKLRHLGNDEVQVIWSEHTRDYRRGIIPTEFGDVLLVIYPLHNHLFRIQINQKPEVPYFGPLYDGAIVDKKILPGLVRATAINAGKIMRSIKPFYQNFYEERAKNVENIITQHKEETMFEEFAASIYAPVLPQATGSDTAGSQPGSEVSSIHSAPYAFTTEDQTDLSKSEKFSQGNSKQSKDVMEPPPSSSNAFSRRLSFGKNKKSVTKTLQAAAAANIAGQGQDTPPDSPNFSKAKK